MMEPNPKSGNIGGGMQATMYGFNKHPLVIDDMTSLLLAAYLNNED